VCRLVQKGHSLRDIGDYTLAQFQMFLDALRETEASERMDFVSDMTAVVGSLFASAKRTPATEQMEHLEDAAAGVKRGNQSQ
jgi:hypothetical protein